MPACARTSYELGVTVIACFAKPFTEAVVKIVSTEYFVRSFRKVTRTKFVPCSALFCASYARERVVIARKTSRGLGI
jgi:hypothetical protein